MSHSNSYKFRQINFHKKFQATTFSTWQFHLSDKGAGNTAQRVSNHRFQTGSGMDPIRVRRDSRMLTRLLLPDGGTASVRGYDAVKDFNEIRKHGGYMPGKFSLYQDLSEEENLNDSRLLVSQTKAPIAKLPFRQFQN